MKNFIEIMYLAVLVALSVLHTCRASLRASLRAYRKNLRARSENEWAEREALARVRWARATYDEPDIEIRRRNDRMGR